MALFGFTSFDVYVKPVLNGNNITFDGKVMFEEDGVIYNYYLVDSVPYLEVVDSSGNSITCLPIDNIPSVPDIVDAITSAIPVSNRTNSGNFIAYGEDLSVSFEHLSEDVTITKSKNFPTDCEAVTEGSVALFAILNTVDYKWYNDTLQQKACDAAMSTGTTTSGSTVINDLIIVAHSMGNSMLAGALATGKCSIGRDVDWVDLSGPMKGSMGSDFLYKICGVDGNSETLLSKLGGLIGQCPGSITRRSLVYDGGDYCDSACSLRYAAARAMHKKYVTAGICGTTYNGLLSKEYAGLLIGGLIIPHHSSKNDGIVEFQSCVGDLDASKFDTTYASNWYAAKLNHADTTFHNGDGLFDSAQKPLKWFECLL
ncbi:Hypothetical protein PHPALM_12378 [Phytophthora palmivora]|uniref:Uncharacterized protein n=1 Tax=Phytophthora palmivora TaxID=4796 RepID=A0A2P4XZW9_9STRA|nr:Hypothetical protein PHPALM_12378 [Phytophthora palmivora]